ncbi:hypothetical cytosolic protein [Syntrophus aciditrophicus SB]|uniref:Hypothetical cytosolic protein n=1 Tax=Syntrophus aciditrophicus (strain SB) TaxID=56780 RepID=Q2LWX4_SYNAS|nr:hypothetical cytosolic protein [Syntrophus aciditrophicus SB]
MKFPRILFRLAGMILLIFCLEGCTEPADQKEDGPLSGSPSQFEVTEAGGFRASRPGKTSLSSQSTPGQTRAADLQHDLVRLLPFRTAPFPGHS